MTPALRLARPSALLRHVRCLGRASQPSFLFQRAVVARRWQSEYQPPSQQQQQPEPEPSKKPSAYRQFYSTFGYSILKVFLGALFTYELLYWAWLKLESLETTEEKNEEIKSLQGQLKELAGGKA